MDHVLPTVPAIDAYGDIPKGNTVYGWVLAYDRGQYDNILTVYKLDRIVVLTGLDKRNKINELVIARLNQLSEEELAVCTPKDSAAALHAVQGELGTFHFVRQKSWHYWVLETSRNRKHKKMNSRTRKRRVNAQVLDMFGGDWDGAVPDGHVIKSKEGLEREIISEDKNTTGVTIVRTKLTVNEYLGKIQRGKNCREIVDGLCYVEADKDLSKCRAFDIRTMEDADEIIFN